MSVLGVKSMKSMMSDDEYFFVKNTILDNFLKLAKVNILTGEHHFLKYDTVMKEEGYESISNIYAYIEKQVSDQLVLSEYAVDYLKYANPKYVQKRIFEDGDRRILQSFKRKLHTGYIWVTFGIVVPDDISVDNPWALFYWQKADTNTTTMVDALSTLSTIYYKILKINLTADSFQVIKTELSERDRFSSRLDKISEWWSEFETAGYVYQEDTLAFREFTNMERLQSTFKKNSGQTQSFRYRRKIGEDWRWVQMDLLPSIEYDDANQVLILYVRDVHDEYMKEKRTREALLDEYHRDALTRLYNRHKYNEDIERLSKGNIPRITACYVDVNGLHEINNLLGHEKGDDLLCTVADTLKKYFLDDYVYRIGGDEFVVLSNRLSKQSMENMMQQAQQDLQKFNYAIAVGIESSEGDLAIHKLIGAAELNMRADKERYYRENGGQKHIRSLNDELEKTLAEKRNAERFLNLISDQFNGVFFVNLELDVLQYIYIPFYFLELLEQADSSYCKAMHLYMGKYVQEEYYEKFEEVLDYEKLKERLRHEKLVSFSYRKVDGNKMHLHIANQNDKNEECVETIWVFSQEQINNA